MAQNSGFFDSLEVNGEYDRMYSANDYCDNLATIITNGVRYSPDDDLAVTPAGGMALSVNIGRAWINGHYYYNDAVYTELTVPTAPTGTNKRIDRVILRLDTTVAVRNISLMLLQGTAAAEPTAPALTRTEDIYDIALADIYIDAAQTALDVTDIVDQRENENVCGWAASVTRAIISLLKHYSWHTKLEAATNTVTFFIPQYEADSVSILKVYTNGVLETLGESYTLDADTITFTGTRQAGAEIRVDLYKSIDGTGLASVADEVTALQNTVATLKGDYDNVYYCNGVNDNVMLSDLAQVWLAAGDDYASRTIRVVGEFGATAAYGGLGTSASRYKWFEFGTAANTSRTITFDFSACSQIALPITAGTYNDVFYGQNVRVIGANVVAAQSASGTYIRMFNSASGAVYAENCRFWITAALTSYISQTGTFKNCRCSVTVTEGSAYCFYPTADALLRVEGGEHYAYAVSGYTAAVVYLTAAAAVAILYGANCPTVARSGYVQTYAVYATAGKVSLTDTITTLTIDATGANIRGTLAVSKPNMM